MYYRVALAGPLYTGKTTLAKRLEEHGYQRVGLSLTLATYFVKWKNEVEQVQPPLTVEQVYANKADFRRELQQFSRRQNFDTDMFWTDQTIIDQQVHVDRPHALIVWDSVRFPQQASYLRDMYHFKIVAIDLPDEDIVARGISQGVPEATVRKALQQPSEQRLPESVIDLHLDGRRSPDELAMLLLTIRV